jgi:hypothetical protein
VAFRRLALHPLFGKSQPQMTWPSGRGEIGEGLVLDDDVVETARIALALPAL